MPPLGAVCPVVSPDVWICQQNGGRRAARMHCSSRVSRLRCICCSLELCDGSNTVLSARVHSHLSRLPLMPISFDDSTVMSEGLCTLLWSIETDVLDGYLLFITGDPVALGCWEPDMAIPLSPSIKSTNLWRTEIKVPCGIHFKYNYFIKAEQHPSLDITRRPGPEYSLSIPLFSREKNVIVVRDSWMRSRVNRMPLPSWGSWMMDANFVNVNLEDGSHQASVLGEHRILRLHNGGPMQGKHFSVDSASRASWELTELSNSNIGERLSESDQPVEEPWIFRTTLRSTVDVGELGPSDQDGLQEKDPTGKLKDIEQPATSDDHRAAHRVEPTSTIILINSSVCTMQRTAVLEDGKLVELLLEPVKNNVQCDSIYLGVVTKLVPHMGGAFVDIGISRPSLMSIKHKREPLVYPPFQEVKGEATSGNFKHDQSVYDDEMIDEFLEVDHHDDSSEFLNEDNGEHDDDDLDFSHSLKASIDNNSIEFSVDDPHFARSCDENGAHIEVEDNEDALLVEGENSNDFGHSVLAQYDSADSKDHRHESRWSCVRKGTKVIVQVVKEGLGTKGPALSPYPNLRSRFWILITQYNKIGVSKKIAGAERTRLKGIAKALQPPGFGLTVRTVAAGHSPEELRNDLNGLLSTWKGIIEHAKSAALAAEEGVEGAVPVMLHRAMGQTLSVVQDYFNDKVRSMVVDSPRTYHEVTSYLQEIAPELCSRVELYEKRTPIFDEHNIEDEINNILCKRVPLPNGGSLVIEQTEALVSIDVNGGHCMLGQGTSQEKAVLDVNLAAAKQIARELRLRDIGGIIVVDFIDMADDVNRRLVYEEMKREVERDRSTVRVSELSKLGLMEITRKRVRPSVSFMISEPCSCCHATGRVEALETSFSKIEHEICCFIAALNQKPDPQNPKSWPRFVLRVDRFMCNYLTSGKRTKLAVLSSSLKVWILLKVARGFSRGTFELRPFVDDEENEEQQAVISRLHPTEARTCIPSTKLTLFPVKKWRGRGGK